MLVSKCPHFQNLLFVKYIFNNSSNIVLCWMLNQEMIIKSCRCCVMIHIYIHTKSRWNIVRIHNVILSVMIVLMENTILEEKNSFWGTSPQYQLKSSFIHIHHQYATNLQHIINKPINAQKQIIVILESY